MATGELIDSLKLENQEQQIALQKEFRDKIDDMRDVRHRLKEMQAAHGRITSELKAADSEITQQLAVLVESLQEEQGIRNGEDRELEEAIRATRLRMDEINNSRKEEEERIELAMEEVARRVDEANKAGQQECSRLNSVLMEERKEREIQE